MAVNNKRAVLRLAAGALSLPARFFWEAVPCVYLRERRQGNPSLLLRWRRLRFRRNR